MVVVFVYCMDMDALAGASARRSAIRTTKGKGLAILGTANWNGTRNENQHRGLVASRVAQEAC
jgi:hypothetical protein